MYHVSQLNSEDSNSDHEAPLVGVEGSRITTLRPVAVAIGMIMFLVPVIAMASHNHSYAFAKANAGAFTELVADGSNDPCKDFPFLKFESVLNNNLGNGGPDKNGPEGIHIKASNKDIDGKSTPLELHVNAKESVNGLSKVFNLNGQFGSISLGTGEANLVFRAYPDGSSDKMKAGETPEPMTLDKVDLSFFDLDKIKMKGNEVSEFVRIKDFKKAFTSSKSNLDRIAKDGTLTFKATHEDQSGGDDPSDPTKLNDSQMNKAVSIEYENFKEKEITLGVVGENGRRVFSFIGRPSILCAEGASDDNGPVTISQDGEIVDDRCCLIKVGPVKILCSAKEEKSFYQFMC